VKKPPVQYTKTRDGVRIAYCVAGDGPPLMGAPIPSLMHTDYDWDVFFRVMPKLAERFRLAWYDARGTGNSERTIEHAGIDAMMLDFEAVADAVGFAEFAISAFVYAPIAVEFAARHPERVSGLVITDAQTYAPSTMKMLDTARAMLELDFDLYTETQAKVMLGIDEPEYTRQLARVYREACSQEVALLYADEARHWPRHLDAVRAPTLVVNNRNFKWAPVEVSQEIAAGIPGARLVRIDDPLYESVPAMIAEFLLGSSDDTSQETSISPFRTVLFTDIVGHTAIMQRLGDTRGRDLLRDHERITRELLAEHGGTEVKTMGDGFMASFASVTTAMDCAIALQRAFAAREGEPLQIRVGLNAGEPIEEDGDLFGAAVILASRVCARADAGEILIPEPVRHLLAGKSYVYADRGETMLKGFEDAVRLFEVRWRD
jgi:class 3 adenylate cyclase/pimeloyl-ACP methyl ester carboxylesterase